MTDSNKEQAWKENLKQGRSWLRGFYMIIVVALGFVACLLSLAVIVFQFIAVLLTRNPNAQLLSLGASLSEYIRQAIVFLTYNTEDKPFPFSEWPAKKSESASSHSAEPSE